MIDINFIIKMLPLLGISSTIFACLGWLNTRSKLKLEIRNCYVGDDFNNPLVSINIVNIGNKNLTLAGFYGKISKSQKLVILGQEDDSKFKISQTFYKTLMPSAKCECQLPYSLFKSVLSETQKLYIQDSSGKRWFFSKKEIKKIQSKI